MNPQPPPVPPPDDHIPPASAPPPVPPPPEPGPLPPPVPGVPAPPEYSTGPAPAYAYPPQQPPPPSYYGPPVVPPGSSAPSALKIIGIGCGVIALVAAAGLIWLVVWGVGKAKKFAENPEKSIAELVISSQPDLEVVNTDQTTQTVTIRNKATGEEMTMNFNDLREGRFIMAKPDGSTVELTPQGMKVTEADGTVSMAAGTGAAAPPPAWVPPYPRVAGQVLSSASIQNGEATGVVIFRTDDSFDVAMQTYKAILDEAFSGTSFAQANINGQERGEFSGSQKTPDGKTRKVEGIVVRAESQTTVTIKYSEKAE